MFGLFHKSREKTWATLAEAAKTYLSANYIEPLPKKPDANGKAKTEKYSRKKSVNEATPPAAKAQDSGIRYSYTPPAVKAGTDIKFSRRDNYNSDSIDEAMREMLGPSFRGSLNGTIRALDSSTDMSFVDKMLEYISDGHLRDSDVYKAAQVDRRLFSKIVSDRSYKPAKDTCIALALALRLSLGEASDFLSRAGYVLSHSSKRDVVIEYFFRERIYNLDDVNEILFRLDQKIIGRQY